MAQLPPDGEYLVQQIGDDVVVFQRWTEDELARWPVADIEATGKAQEQIAENPDLTPEQKAMAHFWAGYFYAHAHCR